MANAAIYVNEISEVRNEFTWSDYFEKLLQGRRDTINNWAAKRNEAYSYGMVLATRLVVKELLTSSEILEHVFVAFTFCYFTAVPNELLVKYVKSNLEDIDEDEVLMV